MADLTYPYKPRILLSFFLALVMIVGSLGIGFIGIAAINAGVQLELSSLITLTPFQTSIFCFIVSPIGMIVGIKAIQWTFRGIFSRDKLTLSSDTITVPDGRNAYRAIAYADIRDIELMATQLTLYLNDQSEVTIKELNLPSDNVFKKVVETIADRLQRQ